MHYRHSKCMCNLDELIKKTCDHEQKNLGSYDCDDIATKKLFHMFFSVSIL
jgi:hypothetical protein